MNSLAHRDVDLVGLAHLCELHIPDHAGCVLQFIDEIKDGLVF